MSNGSTGCQVLSQVSGSAGGLSEGHQNELSKESDIGLFSPSKIREGRLAQVHVGKAGHSYLDCTLW